MERQRVIWLGKVPCWRISWARRTTLPHMSGFSDFPVNCLLPVTVVMLSEALLLPKTGFPAWLHQPWSVWLQHTPWHFIQERKYSTSLEIASEHTRSDRNESVDTTSMRSREVPENPDWPKHNLSPKRCYFDYLSPVLFNPRENLNISSGFHVQKIKLLMWSDSTSP